MTHNHLRNRLLRQVVSLSLMRHSFPFAAQHHHIEIVGKPVFHAEKNAARDEDLLFEAICVRLGDQVEPATMPSSTCQRIPDSPGKIRLA